MYKKVLLIAVLLLTQQAGASSLEVSPTTVNFSGSGKNNGENVQSVWLTNAGDTPLRGQVRIYQWDQHDNRDVLLDTRSIIASPPFLDIPAGEKQLVRLINTSESNLHAEQAYRLLIDEVPAPGDEHTHEGVKFQLRYSVPVFVQAEKPSSTIKKPDHDLNGVLFSIGKDGDTPVIVVTNTQTHHVKLSRLTWVSPQGKRTVIYSGLMGYVLAGKQNAFPVNGAGQRGYFEAVMNDSKSPQRLLTLPG